jgi:hypothetical protein
MICLVLITFFLYQRWHDKLEKDAYFRNKFETLLFIHFTYYTNKRDSEINRLYTAFNGANKDSEKEICKTMSLSGYNQYETEKIRDEGFVNFMKKEKSIEMNFKKDKK